LSTSNARIVYFIAALKDINGVVVIVYEDWRYWKWEGDV